MKLLLAVALIAAPANAPYPRYSYFTPNPLIKLVVCEGPIGTYSGTAFVVGPNVLLTANHVIARDNCNIDGEPVNIVSTAPDLDFAVLTTARAYAHWFPIDCGGFRPGEYIYAHGHGQGRPGNMVVVARATGFGEQIFDGVRPFARISGNDFIHGQSGGPVFTGRGVTGMVNAVDEGHASFSRELKDTVACR